MHQLHPIRILQMIWLSLRCGSWIPFKIYSSSQIRIKTGAKLENSGRLTIGTQKSQAVVSIRPTNLFLGLKSRLITGNSVYIGPGVNLILKENSSVSIGNNTYFTSDNHIEAMKEIFIGQDCAISWGVTIIDSDHHHLISGSEKNVDSGVKIGNHVWVGCNSTILKNTKIGDNCVVAAGSIVKGVFPDNCLIAGNPAKVVRENINWN